MSERERERRASSAAPDVLSRAGRERLPQSRAPCGSGGTGSAASFSEGFGVVSQR